MKNFPEPKTNADRIALKAAELLDQDVWERVSDSSVWVRGIRFVLETSSGYVSVPVDPSHDATILNWERPSKEIGHIFMAAFNGAMARKREVLLVPKVQQISNDAWEKVIASEARKLFWRSARKAAAWAIVAGIAIGVAVGGMVSCARAGEANQLARDSQVNEYGFRYGDLQHHLKYPKDCQWQRPGKGLADCKQVFEEWERRGSSWIEWEATP